MVFRTSWDLVFRSVAMAVAWGRDHVDLAGIEAIGIDEIQWQHGHHSLTLVFQIDAARKRLLWIGQERRVKTLLKFFRVVAVPALDLIDPDRLNPGQIHVIAAPGDGHGDRPKHRIPTGPEDHGDLLPTQALRDRKSVV